jgi:hypothetical protein
VHVTHGLLVEQHADPGPQIAERLGPDAAPLLPLNMATMKITASDSGSNETSFDTDRLATPSVRTSSLRCSCQDAMARPV